MKAVISMCDCAGLYYHFEPKRMAQGAALGIGTGRDVGFGSASVWRVVGNDDVGWAGDGVVCTVGAEYCAACCVVMTCAAGDLAEAFASVLPVIAGVTGDVVCPGAATFEALAASRFLNASGSVHVVTPVTLLW